MNNHASHVATRLINAGKEGILQEFSKLCQEANTTGELVNVVETLDMEFHSGTIGEDWVDWREVNTIIAYHIIRVD